MKATNTRAQRARRGKGPHARNGREQTILRTPLSRRDDAPPSPCRHVLASTLALALASSIGLAGIPAFAAESDEVSSERSTSVSLQGTVSQLSVTVPTALPVMVKGDGSFVETSMAIENNSIFDVCVTEISATPVSPFELTTKDEFGLDEETRDLFWMTLAASAETVDLGEAIAKPTVLSSPSWNVGRAESANSSLAVRSNGAIKNVDSIGSDRSEALRISFTIEAGSH